MIHPALRHLAWRQFAGGMRHRLKQLRRPQYAIPVVLLALYFGSISVFPLGADSPGMPDFPGMISGYAGAFLALLLAIHWVVAIFRPAPHFSAAEATQLFVLPFTRRQLVGYALLRPVPGLLLAATLVSLLWLRYPGVRLMFLFPGFLLALWVISAHQTMSALGVNALRRAGQSRAVQLLPALLIAAWLVLPVLLSTSDADTKEPLGLGHTGWIHWPLRAVGSVLAAQGGAEYFTGMAVLAALASLLVVGCMLLAVPFEEAALSQAEQTGNKLDAMRHGGVAGFRLAGLRTTSSSTLALPPVGKPWVAALWASRIGEWRGGPWHLLSYLALLYGAVVLGLAAFDAPKAARLTLLVMPAGLMLPVIAAISRIMAVSLRAEFPRLELLKSLPLTGHALLRGRAWGVALAAGPVLGLIALVLAIAAVTLPDTPPRVLAVVAAAAPALVAWVALMAALESLLVLAFPAWMVSAPGEAQLEQMGRTMFGLFLQWAAASVLLILAALAGVLVGFVFGAAGLGFWGVIPGLLAGACALAAEVELVLAVAGRRYDSMDALVTA